MWQPGLNEPSRLDEEVSTMTLLFQERAARRAGASLCRLGSFEPNQGCVHSWLILYPRPPMSVWQTRVPPGRVTSWEPTTAWCRAAAASRRMAPCWPSPSRRWWPSGTQPPGSSWPRCPSRPKPSGQSTSQHSVVTVGVSTSSNHKDGTK